jgi:hypothetical protein
MSTISLCCAHPKLKTAGENRKSHSHALCSHSTKSFSKLHWPFSYNISLLICVESALWAYGVIILSVDRLPGLLTEVLNNWHNLKSLKQPEWRDQHNEQATEGTTKRTWFDSWQRPEIFPSPNFHICFAAQPASQPNDVLALPLLVNVTLPTSMQIELRLKICGTVPPFPIKVHGEEK